MPTGDTKRLCGTLAEYQILGYIARKETNIRGRKLQFKSGI
jgi:hypothetical protein